MQTAAAGIAHADTVDLSAYRARLRDARELLAQARSAPDAQRFAIVARARAALTQTDAIALREGTILRIDDSRVAARLGTTSAALDAGISDVDQLLALAEAAAQPPFDSARAEARFRDLAGSTERQSVAGGLLTFLRELIARLLGVQRGAEIPNGTIETVLVILGIGLLAVIAAILLRGVRERIRRETVERHALAAAGTDPAEQLALAERSLAGGDPRSALHAFYRYAILTLAARRLIRYEPSLTDREVLERAASLPHVDTLRELIALHDRSWFGLKGTTADEASHARTLAERAVA